MENLLTSVPGLNLPVYTQLICQYNPPQRALWYYMNPQPQLCFTSKLLEEMRDLQERVTGFLHSSSEAADQIHYFVKASAMPGLFNLGGDLKLFVDLINKRDRDALYEYGRICVDVVYHNAIGLGVPTLTTIAVVQGSALGGGFEAALANNVIVAEQSAELGFPEILFNLFPGMGAYSFLSRRIDAIHAERLLRSGEQHTARALQVMGVVDVLAPDGEGVHVANEFMRQRSRARNGHLAIQLVRQRINPVSHQELLDIVEMWVEAALRLTPRNLRMMNRLVAAQSRLDLAEPNVEQAA